MTPRRRAQITWAAPIALLLAAALVAVLPRLSFGTSAALLTTSANATGNVATAGTCSTGSKSWNSSSNGGLLDTAVLASSTHSVWNRFDAGSGISNDSWMSTNTWTNSSMTAGASGALYCDSDTGISSTANTNYAASASVPQATLGLTSTSTNVLMLWFKTTSTASTLASLSDGTSADRQLWVDATGYLRFSARSGASNSSWTSTASGSLVNDGAWHFAVVSMTGYGSASGGATLYLDGASLTSVTGKASPFRNFTSNVRWYVGDDPATTYPSSTTTAGAIGSFDEFVVVTTSTLTSAQIVTLYQSADL